MAAFSKPAAGSTVVFLDGTYPFIGDNSYYVSVDGTADRRIVFKAENPGKVTIRGSKSGYHWAPTVMFGTKGNYTDWNGIGFTEGYGTGVRIETTSNVTFTNCTFFHNVGGVNVLNGKNIRFESCEFYENFVQGFGLISEDRSDVHTATVNLRNCVARDNRPEFDTRTDGSQSTELNTDGFYAGIDDVPGSFVCESCVAYGNLDAGFDISADFVVTKSLSYGNGSLGFKFWNDGVLENSIAVSNIGPDSDSGVSVSESYRDPNVGTRKPGVPTVLIQGVTIANNGYKGIYAGGDVTMRNSIIAFNSRNIRAADILGALDDDYNLWKGPAGGGTFGADSDVYSGKGAHSITGDPLFVDVATMNYHLRSTSPAVDKGTASVSYRDDYDGTLRPQFGGFDIGAYELK